MFGDDAVCYTIQDSRSADAARAILDGYSGVVMCDGYTAYETLRKRGRQYSLAHCWAHVRRAFLECEQAFPNDVAAMIANISELYAIDASCLTGPPGDDDRRRLRAERSKPVLERIRAWMIEAAGRAPPTSALRKAIDYTSRHWSGLTRFVDDPRIPLDNNASERALRGPVVGRKNHYGSRSKRGTEVAALLYTLVESAGEVGIEPKAYLREATECALRGRTIPLPHEMAAHSF